MVGRRRGERWRLAPSSFKSHVHPGFPVGAMVASGAPLRADAGVRPSFAALIYGAPVDRMPAIAPTLPPVFMAWAQDDEQAREPATRCRDALVAAGNRPEVHVYASGGHGFGLKTQGTTSDHWIDELLW